MSTGLRQRLEAVYAATHYQVAAPGAPFVLRVGERSPALAALYSQAGTQQAAYLTAFNPASQAQPEALNRAANALLEQALQALGHPYLHGYAIDPEGQWISEASFLVLGPERAVALDLGRRFGQCAILYAGSEAIPTLCWLIDR